MSEGPIEIRIGFVFSNPHPFDERQFRKVLKDLKVKGTFGIGAGARTTGESVPVTTFQYDRGGVFYMPTSGILSLQPIEPDDASQMVEQIVTPLRRKAKLEDDDISGVELDASFLEDVEDTALAVLRKSLPNSPAWASSVLGGDVGGWGIRCVSSEAVGARRPFRTLTPWRELVVEPFADNPKKMFVRIVIRERNWPALQPHVLSVTKKADRVLRELAR